MSHAKIHGEAVGDMSFGATGSSQFVIENGIRGSRSSLYLFGSQCAVPVESGSLTTTCPKHNLP